MSQQGLGNRGSAGLGINEHLTIGSGPVVGTVNAQRSQRNIACNPATGNQHIAAIARRLLGDAALHAGIARLRRQFQLVTEFGVGIPAQSGFAEHDQVVIGGANDDIAIKRLVIIVPGIRGRIIIVVGTLRHRHGAAISFTAIHVIEHLDETVAAITGHQPVSGYRRIKVADLPLFTCSRVVTDQRAAVSGVDEGFDRNNVGSRNGEVLDAATGRQIIGGQTALGNGDVATLAFHHADQALVVLIGIERMHAAGIPGLRRVDVLIMADMHFSVVAGNIGVVGKYFYGHFSHSAISADNGQSVIGSNFGRSRQADGTRCTTLVNGDIAAIAVARITAQSCILAANAGNHGSIRAGGEIFQQGTDLELMPDAGVFFSVAKTVVLCLDIDDIAAVERNVAGRRALRDDRIAAVTAHRGRGLNCRIVVQSRVTAAGLDQFGAVADHGEQIAAGQGCVIGDDVDAARIGSALVRTIILGIVIGICRQAYITAQRALDRTDRTAIARGCHHEAQCLDLIGGRLRNITVNAFVDSRGAIINTIGRRIIVAGTEDHRQQVAYAAVTGNAADILARTIALIVDDPAKAVIDGAVTCCLLVGQIVSGKRRSEIPSRNLGTVVVRAVISRDQRIRIAVLIIVVSRNHDVLLTAATVEEIDDSIGALACCGRVAEHRCDKRFLIFAQLAISGGVINSRPRVSVTIGIPNAFHAALDFVKRPVGGQQIALFVGLVGTNLGGIVAIIIAIVLEGCLHYRAGRIDHAGNATLAKRLEIILETMPDAGEETFIAGKRGFLGFYDDAVFGNHRNVAAQRALNGTGIACSATARRNCRNEADDRLGWAGCIAAIAVGQRFGSYVVTDAGIHTMITAYSAAGCPHDDVGVGILRTINPAIGNSQTAQHAANVIGFVGNDIDNKNIAIHRAGIGKRIATIAAIAFLDLGREDALNTLAAIGIGRVDPAESKLSVDPFSCQRVSPVETGMADLGRVGIDGARMAVSGPRERLDLDTVVAAINSAWVTIGVSAEVFLVRAVKGSGAIGFKQGVQGIVIA